jgi:16S rRNA G1207 methylase RsmC
VSWLLEQNQGPNSVLRMLTDAGWSITKKRAGKFVMLTGSGPLSLPDPTPEVFEDVVGTDSLRFESDYGVFAAGKVDEGTRLLLDVALREPAVDVLADIGVGYGPLAVGLVRNKIARRAIATDIDAIALWLAGRNAAHNGVELDVHCTADPTAIDPTALTVCNVPTHVNQAATEDLMAGLLRRAEDGRLLVVVHASLQARYERYFRDAGHSVRAHPGPSHVVLATG